MYDIAIIGAGVIGCAAARELSRYTARILVLEREADVCCGTSKANSAIVHAGYDAPANSLMAELNVLGNRMMGELTEELDVAFSRIGSLVVCTREEERSALMRLYENGLQNGVEGLRVVERDELRAMEPNVSDAAVAALYAPAAGIVCPFGLTAALAENAVKNGVEFRLNTSVKNVFKKDGAWALETDGGVILTKCVVNAAGVYAGVFHNMVSERKIHITPRRGDYYLLDKSVGDHVKHVIFALPNKLGKGVLVAPTVHGNLIVGPTAIDVDDPEATNTTAEGLKEVAKKASATVKNVPLREVITSFAGLRAHEDGYEFIVGEAEGAENFFDCAGIESPGLSAAPAIGQRIAGLIGEKLGLARNPNFNGARKGIFDPKTLSDTDYARLLKEKPAYGNIVCRCETVSEGEILDAIHRPLGATTLDGLKRRVRVGSGRCQAGFCTPRALEILARELKIEQSEVTKTGGASRLIVGAAKDALGEGAEG
ncbi:MAG: NAD(P)/FAD-dependent oxidoreductase [Clostridiaceae bacterium]|nr:NAD(P)/FAD-dependent oxidoreductase [Eubacteriales bacterium]